MSQLAPYALDELLEAYKRIWPGGRTRMFLSKAAAFYRILEARAEAAAEADDLVFEGPREVDLKGFTGGHTVVAVRWKKP